MTAGEKAHHRENRGATEDTEKRWCRRVEILRANGALRMTMVVYVGL